MNSAPTRGCKITFPGLKGSKRFWEEKCPLSFEPISVMDQGATFDRVWLFQIYDVCQVIGGVGGGGNLVTGSILIFNLVPGLISLQIYEVPPPLTKLMDNSEIGPHLFSVLVLALIYNIELGKFCYGGYGTGLG